MTQNPSKLDYEKACRFLLSAIDAAEQEALKGDPERPPKHPLGRPLDTLFSSDTKAFREGLVGCVLARLCDPSVDATKPYVKHGDHSYNGRTLDEKVVNPTLRDRQIPISKAPFLSTLRRGVRFTRGMERGVRDQKAFTAFIKVVGYVNRADGTSLRDLLFDLCGRFIGLREAANVTVAKLQRISHEQYSSLIDGLLGIPSGGRFPVFLVDALFHAIRDVFGLDWKIVVQGINVSDEASGVGGDVEIWSEDTLVLAVEITERQVSKGRVQAIFQSKISPASIQDYLFLVTTDADTDAIAQARRYFNQGHEVNFVNLKAYILMTLVSVGVNGRQRFNRILTNRVEDQGTPTTLKVEWNAEITKLTEI